MRELIPTNQNQQIDLGMITNFEIFTKKIFEWQSKFREDYCIMDMYLDEAYPISYLELQQYFYPRDLNDSLVDPNIDAIFTEDSVNLEYIRGTEFFPPRFKNVLRFRIRTKENVFDLLICIDKNGYIFLMKPNLLKIRSLLSNEEKEFTELESYLLRLLYPNELKQYKLTSLNCEIKIKQKNEYYILL